MLAPKKIMGLERLNTSSMTGKMYVHLQKLSASEVLPIEHCPSPGLARLCVTCSIKEPLRAP